MVCIFDYFLNINGILVATGQAHENNFIILWNGGKNTFVVIKYFWTVFIVLVGGLFQHIIYSIPARSISIVRMFVLYNA